MSLWKDISGHRWYRAWYISLIVWGLLLAIWAGLLVLWIYKIATR